MIELCLDQVGGQVGREGVKQRVETFEGVDVNAAARRVAAQLAPQVGRQVGLQLDLWRKAQAIAIRAERDLGFERPGIVGGQCQLVQ